MIYNRLIVAAIGFIRLEPYDGKLSRTVLRGGKDSNALLLPDSAISLDFRNVIPSTPEKDFALSGFFPTDLKLTALRISTHISPRMEIYFNVISNVKINRVGT